MSGARLLRAALGVVDGPEGRRVARDAWYQLDDAGQITAVGAGPVGPEDAPSLVEDLGPTLVLPGLVNAHSHAFQRLIRGQTHRRGAHDPSSFWSWRQAMYAAAARLDPEAFERACRACFAEMLAAGITCVGEFHYLHHQVDGRPYHDPNELSHRVIAAARSVGIRLALLEVYYARAGPGTPAGPEQRRFCDVDLDAYLARVEALRSRCGPDLRLGIAPHSVRAVDAPALRRLAEAAASWDLPLHTHLSEQPRENEICAGEHGRSPTQVFAESGCLDRPGSFTAVHAIFVDDEDRRRLVTQQVCACPTTEADLGDGVLPAPELAAAGARLCLGSDSNAVVDLIQEARLLEMHARITRGARLCFDPGGRGPALALLDAATVHGASSLGFPELGRLAPGRPFDACAVDLRHPSLRDVDPEHALDALLLAGTAAALRETYVDGRPRR